MTELVIVILILGLLAGMAAPSLANLGAMREGTAATRVRAILSLSQEWALATESDTWVVFDTTTDVVTAFGEDLSNPGKANRVALLDPLGRSALSMDLRVEGVDLTTADFGGTTEVQFGPGGTPHDADGNVLGSDGTVTFAGGTSLRVTKTSGLASLD